MIGDAYRTSGSTCTNSMTYSLVSAVGTTVVPATAIWSWIGLTQGHAAALIAMENSGWIVPLLAALSWLASKAFERVNLWRKQQDVIVAKDKQIADMSITISYQCDQIEADRETQIQLRNRLNDALAKLSQYEPKTPNPD